MHSFHKWGRKERESICTWTSTSNPLLETNISTIPTWLYETAQCIGSRSSSSRNVARWGLAWSLISSLRINRYLGILCGYVEEGFYGCSYGFVSEEYGWKGREVWRTSAFSGGFVDCEFGGAGWIHGEMIWEGGRLSVVKFERLRVGASVLGILGFW